MNGLDLVSRLRSRNIVAPIILITGYLDKALPDRAANAGVRHLLRKPHLEESLPDHIREALQDRTSHH
jgi:two-component system, LuxR family, response regulator FixJ